MDIETITADEFLARAQEGDLPTYSGACYFPAWIAPTGEVLIGETHADIARHVVGRAGYTDMFDAGHIRVVPDKDLNNLCVHVSADLHGTVRQKVTLTKLVMGYGIGDWSVVQKAGADHVAKAGDRIHFLQLCQEALA